MTTIRLEFPAGRYHATPHGRHVNEGVPEWPPSPYRLLRSLYDVWQRKCFGYAKNEVEDLLAALAESSPRFLLAPGTAAHTRSYLSANTRDPSEKNLVFDAFVALQRETACYICWPELILSASQAGILERLLENLNYLGRSESWIRATLHDGEGLGLVCEPIDSGGSASGEAVPVACVVARQQYSGKRQWMDALTTSTSEVLKARASGPPLLRTVRYLRPEGSIDTDPVRRPESRPAAVRAVLMTLDCPVLPLETSALEIAEQIRVRLMGAHKRRMGGDERLVSGLFSGKDANGEKRLDHGHLYILPLSNGRGRIDRVLLVSKRSKWSADELDAAYGVRTLYQRDDRPDVRCAIAWQGGLEGAGHVWTPTRIVESGTPFVPPRHWRRGRDFASFLANEVHRECRNHGVPEPMLIEPMASGRPGSGMFECIEFRRNRKGDPVRPGYALRLEFREPVVAPFAIGYGAHFGLGMFRAPLGG